MTAFAFDKTGTLTEGRPELGDIAGLQGVSSEELLQTAATAEQQLLAGGALETEQAADIQAPG